MKHKVTAAFVRTVKKPGRYGRRPARREAHHQ